MYKNQLQELAHKKGFDDPSYSFVQEGPDHELRFKATVQFNGRTYESPFHSTVKRAEKAAAEVALRSLVDPGLADELVARILVEDGTYKNLLQEASQKAALRVPSYTTSKMGPNHQLIFFSTVEIADLTIQGESASTKKQAEKNAAKAAWLELRKLSQGNASSSSILLDGSTNLEVEKDIITRFLMSKMSEETNVTLPLSLSENIMPSLRHDPPNLQQTDKEAGDGSLTSEGNYAF